MLNSLNQVGNNQCLAHLYHAITKEIKPDSNKIDNNTLDHWAKTQRINKTISL